MCSRLGRLEKLLSRSHGTGNITSANSAHGNGNHFGSLFLTCTCEILRFSQSLLSTYSVTSVSNNKRGSRNARKGGLFWDMEILHFSDWFFKSFSLHIPVHPPPPPPPQHLPWDQAKDRWSLGDRRAVRHKQSGYQILPSTPAAQLDLRIHSHLTATPVTDPVTYHTSKRARTHMHKLLPITKYYTSALTLHLIMNSILKQRRHNTADRRNFTQVPQWTLSQSVGTL